MNIDDYVEWARNTGPIKASPAVTNEHLGVLCLALVSDVGEVANVIVRRVRDGTFNRELFAYELGDVIFHLARLCAVTGIAPSELLNRSRNNIEERVAKRSQS